MTNAAYDLSRFDTELNRKPTEETVTQMEVVKSAGLKHGSALKGVVVAVFVIAVCYAMLFSMVRINELSNEVAEQTAVLDKLKSESVVLQTRLDSQMSLANVEEYATNVLGMQKLETSQMQCINIKTNNVITATKTEKSFYDILSDAIDGLMEYLKF